MFGKHFAFGFEGAGEQGWQGWTPPWLQEEHHGHYGHHGHHHGHHGHHHGHEGRGPWQGWGGPRFGQGFGPEQFGPGRPGFGPGQFGPGFGPRFFGMRRGRGPFGHGGPFGPGGDGPRFFGRGDVKFALLALLQERPMHGYEMIKALEEKSGGFYTPSPGSVYPTLQLLEDRGLVTVNEVEGKKVYSITDAGRALLAERQEQQGQPEGPEFGPPWMRRRGGGNRPGPEIQALRSEAMEVARLMAIAGRMSFQNPEQLAKLRTIVERTRKDLSDMIYSGQGQANEGSAAQQSDGPKVENA